MSNTTDNNIYSFKAAQGASCRIAYILDNDQPVKCSIISDQPLFFMDFEDDLELEEEYGDVFDFTNIENGVADLEARIKGLDRFGEDVHEADPEENFRLYLANLYEATAEVENPDTHADIAFIESALRSSRFAASLLDFATEYGTKLMHDSQVQDAVYDREGGQIRINPLLCREDQILLAARELRRVWQHRNGALINPLTFHPDQAILVNRAQIADLSVCMIRTAWELQLAGEKQVWERVETSSMADLARAFARESYLDFRTLNNGVAQSAVFESWFLSERCRIEDKKLIQNMLADYQGYVFDNVQASQNITAELIIALGTMPFGKNYLAPYVSTIMEDAMFTEVRDRSNANFLWFIKFERSFRETEQELQTDSDVSGHDGFDDHITNINKRFGDHEETEIITLPTGGENSPSCKTGTAPGGNNIIQFGPARHRSGKS